MITPNEYRRMAEDCLGWAREAQTDEVRLCYLNLAQTWADAASWIDRASGQRSSAQGPAMRRPAPAREAA
jgi:hypothetical protein